MSETTEVHLSEEDTSTKDLLMANLESAVNRVLPDFQKEMPEDYFHAVDEADQIAHMSTLATSGLAGIDHNLMLTSNFGQCYTFINHKDYSGLLSELIAQLPKDKSLQSAKIFTSKTGQVVIDIFDFSPQPLFETNNPDNHQRLDQLIDSITEYEPDLAMEDLIKLLHTCSEDYVMTTSDRRLCQHFRMIETLWGTDDVKLETLTHSRNKLTDITIGFGNGDTREVFERFCAYLGRHNINIHRAHSETFLNDQNERVSMIGFLVSDEQKSNIDLDCPEWQIHLNHLQQLPALSDDALALYFENNDWSLRHAELLFALARLVHQRLCKIDSYQFSLERISKVFIKHHELSQIIFDYVLEKFTPATSSFIEKKTLLADDILINLSESDAEIIRTLEQAAHSILKTNIYFRSRYALAFRIDPAFLQIAERDVLPYGVFFMHGKNFMGSHVRFRDIARGGMRIVRPRNFDDYLQESVRLYDENYALAYAQQLKNKDIPEGGSKGVLLTTPGSVHEQSGRAYANSLLDLISNDEQTKSQLVDYYGKEELLYLGPDENVTPALIDWIIQRAHYRQYPMANTFMSSKAAIGINHKVYGVTSEGVTVFLDAALRQEGIDPTQDQFTVKITGGPDGDVAGNEILILDREYGENAVIVGIADGSGTAEDPGGLDHKELIRLVKASSPIVDFDPSKLSVKGCITTVETTEGVQARNTMHFRLVADTFIPAGGRPQAINGSNWEQFIQKDGTPSSRIIVEGANLFITAEAREKLSKAGVMIIKDSSANKCGVICSSLEILAGMLTTESEFADIKPQYIEQTLSRLRSLAKLEADALFRTQSHYPHLTLPELSLELSIQINRLHDAIACLITTPSAEDQKRLRTVVKHYIPEALLELVGPVAIEKIPTIYTKQIVASVLASQIIYSEGINYCRHMNEENMAEIAIKYLHYKEEVSELIDAIEISDLEQKDRMIALLKAGGYGAAIKLG
ncbi:MAG: NAD-glutamate dehydrogenase domain-containing protein [Gammaproteobacteria bacterium]